MAAEPVNGGWTDYGSYSACSHPCGGGNKTRHRGCTNPPPAYGGSNCSGSSVQSMICNTRDCRKYEIYGI